MAVGEHPNGGLNMTDNGAQRVVEYDTLGNVKGGVYSKQVTITRPANTTPYTAVDAVGAAAAAFEIAGIGPSGGLISIVSCALEIDVASVPAGMTSFTLYLYSVTPPSALADNAAWSLASGDMAAYIGSLALGTPVDIGTALYVTTTNTNGLHVCRLAGTSIFAYLVTAGGFTPAGNSEVYKVTLHTKGL